MEPSPLFFTVVALSIFLVGFTKGGFGGAGGALATPMLVLVLPADRALGVMLPILVLADGLALMSHWGRWDIHLIALILPGAAVGVALATVFLTRISPEGLRRGIGIIILLFVIYKLIEPKLSGSDWYHPRGWHGVLAGTVAGVTSTLAHTGGPPISIYLLQQKMKPRAFVATSVLFFAVLNWVKTPIYYFAGFFDFTRLWGVAWLLPLLPVSVWVGRKAATRVKRTVFDRIIVVLLAVSAVILLTT